MNVQQGKVGSGVSDAVSKAFLVFLVLISFNNLWGGDTYQAVYKTDIDGDSKEEVFTYKLMIGMPHVVSMMASMKVVSGKGETLWESEWGMEENDLKVLMEEEERKSVKEWAEKFFENTNFALMGTFSKKKLPEDYLDKETIQFWAKKLKISYEDIKKEILSQKTNFLMSYRESWREDLMLLVYLPKYKKFIQYSHYGL